VTILLRQGVSDNLQDVETLTSDAKNGQFIWTPSTSLPNGNYFGPFTIQGASSSASASTSSGTSPSAYISASPIASAK
jgi:hypothetical protein